VRGIPGQIESYYLTGSRVFKHFFPPLFWPDGKQVRLHLNILHNTVSVRDWKVQNSVSQRPEGPGVSNTSFLLCFGQMENKSDCILLSYTTLYQCMRDRKVQCHSQTGRSRVFSA
jgi:hypothetical protein